jgi:S-adenosylmethionine hydrolase
MADPLITLTTDFGTDSPYVAAMKGVILNINPTARLVDLSHEIPPQNLRHVSFFLAESLAWFPPDTIHIVVVDPGVGSSRSLLYVALAGQQLLVPDNGCWTLLAQSHTRTLRVITLNQPRFWRPQISSTFHGRDILAPVAGYLSLGIQPAELGTPATSWEQLPWPAPARHGCRIHGEVIFVDRFGNLISNIPGSVLATKAWEATMPGIQRPLRRVRTYSDAQPGELVALISSSGLLEIAIVQGSAARELNPGPGAPVWATWELASGKA